MKRSVAVPAPNQMAPQRARWSPKYPRASGGKSAADAMAATASATGGESSHASGGDSTLYAGVWWPPYHWPFQMVKPSWPNRSARKVCAARSTVRGCQIRYAVVKIAATTIGAAFHGSMRLYQRARGSRRGKRGDCGAASSAVASGEETGAETEDDASRSTKGTG